ncbi:MAG: TlpA disulfide reductase family protein [Bacteroidota bacterium]
MKQLMSVIGCLLVTAIVTAKPQYFQNETPVKVYFEGTKCSSVGSLSLFQFNGMNFQLIQAADAQPEKAVIENKQMEVFQFEVPTTEPRFYYIGFGPKNILPILLGSEKEVRVRGNCQQLRSARILQSPLNEAYGELRTQFNTLNAEMSNMIRRYRAAQDTASRGQVIRQFAQHDKKRLKLRSDLEESQPYLAKIASLQTYLSFHNYGEGYLSEVDYFVNEYFHFADWKDADYNYMAWVYEATKNYTETISGFGLPETGHKKALDNILAKIPDDTRTKQLAWSGIIAGLQAKSHPNFAAFALPFAEKYKDSDPEAVAVLQQKIKQAATFMTGVEAPDFEMATPEGEQLKMSDLRGKVVLVDFWASWCGPCRRENPRVVKLYNKYKDKGFEILGVSLDSNKDRWLKAIKDDRLTWPQVSDLRGWQNAAAKMYGVRSIPHTMLLDAEGKIIGRNYRSHTLEAKLKEIFGE